VTATPLVVQPDVETALLRPLTDSEAEFIDSLCDVASVRMRTAMPSVDLRIAAFDPATGTGLDPAAVAAMLGDVVARALSNATVPAGASSESEATGPYSRTTSYRSAVTRAVVITPADLAQLSPSAAFVMPGTIRTTPVRHGWRSW